MVAVVSLGVPGSRMLGFGSCLRARDQGCWALSRWGSRDQGCWALDRGGGGGMGDGGGRVARGPGIKDVGPWIVFEGPGSRMLGVVSLGVPGSRKLGFR